MVILSFCRGEILPKFDRMAEAYESKQLPDVLGSSLISPIKQTLPKDKIRKIYRRLLKHPEAEIPPECYVLYTTLPDSK